jgi:ribose 1,5-bisphosphate isomerase
MDIEEIARRVAAIQKDRDKGAAQLARDAVQLLGSMASEETIPDAQFAELFSHTARALGRARPSMAPLLNGAGTLLAAWLGAGGESRPVEARRTVAESAEQWLTRQETAAAVVADHAARAISGTVITLSYSSTVLRALAICWDRNLLTGVIVAESRPLFEGRRTAAELASRGIPVALITDAEMGIFVSTANFAVVGADTIMAGGAVANKAGTLLLALAARRAHVPLFTLADTQKIAPAPGRHRRMPFTIEEKDPDEVLPQQIVGVAVRNAYFDLTPGRYVTGYVTEDGLLSRRDVTERAKRASGAILL